MKANPISRKYAPLHRVSLALDRRVELIAGPMMTITTATMDMSTRVNRVRDAFRFPLKHTGSLRAARSLEPGMEDRPGLVD